MHTPDTVAEQHDAGFSLIETMVAVSVLGVGLLSLAGLLTAGVKMMMDVPADLIAKQKATEAVESVYTARDTRSIPWARVRNVSAGGVFLVGPQDVKLVGADGLVNTADDGEVETTILPGTDGRLGTDDDVVTSLSRFQREIRIVDVSATLREVVVTVTYTTGTGRHEHVLRTFISPFA